MRLLQIPVLFFLLSGCNELATAVAEVPEEVSASAVSLEALSSQEAQALQSQIDGLTKAIAVLEERLALAQGNLTDQGDAINQLNEDVSVIDSPSIVTDAPFWVYDDLGEERFPALGLRGEGVVVQLDNGFMSLLEVADGYLRPSSQLILWYESSDCSGPAYAKRSDSAWMRGWYYSIHDGSYAVAIDHDAPAVSRTLQSLGHPGSCASVAAAIEDAYAVPASESIPDEYLVEMPYSLRPSK
jgi:hypothetical protein